MDERNTARPSACRENGVIPAPLSCSYRAPRGASAMWYIHRRAHRDGRRPAAHLPPLAALIEHLAKADCAAVA
jgi:hypothetical protein